MAMTLAAQVSTVEAAPSQAPAVKAPAAAAQAAAPATPRLAAQFDMTGHWVSIVSEDWIYRMLVGPKGDTGSIPVNDAAKQATAQWDPARDAGSCKAYGVGGLIRRPGRLNIGWADDRTLRIDFDAGLQTRLLHFSERLPPSGYETSDQPSNFVVPANVGPPTLQGYTVAAWHRQGQSRGMGPMQSHTVATQGGSLAAITQDMLPGYLQSNGVPYSSEAILHEYFDLVQTSDGIQYLIVTSIVDDPTFLTQPYVTTTPFKREKDGSKWDPTPC
jgi:hypothetical protein